MTRGLKALHDMKILHRDLKSANIFLESDGSAKIGDLNVSKVAKKGLGYTQTGTPYYASPEVWKDNPYDYKSDIWSLGCVTYEMAMLHPPFRAQNMEGLYNKVIKGQYGKLSEKFSSDLGEVIKMLLKVNPSDRPNCGQILKCPIVKKRLEYFQAQSGFDFDVDMDEGMLLKTIRIPKNILFLTDRLPGANYSEGDKVIFNKKYTFPNNNLPNIKRSSDNEKNHDVDLKQSNNEKKNLKVKKNVEDRKNNINILNERNYIKNKNLNENYLNYDYNNVNINYNHHNNHIQKKYNQQKKIKQQKYLEGLGLSEIYKVYAPNLDGNNNYGPKKNKRQYANYVPGMYNQKKPSYNNNYPRVIPNKRLNPLKKKK